MRSIKSRKTPFWAAAVMVALGIVLAGLVGATALRDAPFLEDGRAALGRLRSTGAQLVPPPLRRWLAGSGQPATAIRLYDPVGLAEDARGNLYFADRGEGRVMGLDVGHFIWRIGPDGRAEVIAGTGVEGAPADGEPALEADLGDPAGLALDPKGRLHFADPRNHVVMRIEADGRLRRIAGTGAPGDGGDGGDARTALLNRPYDVAFDGGGNLYIADHANHRVRKVTQGGVITTVAGTGAPGFTGDHGPATQARLDGVYGVLAHPDGRLLIADSGNHVVRQVAADGTITTFAATGEAGSDGDGGPAVRARLNAPESLFVDRTGRLYVGDEASHNIRVIDPDGTIKTLIGDGAPGYAVIGQPAGTAPLNDPEYLLVRKDGTVVISDGDTGRLLTIDLEGRVALVAGLTEHGIADAMGLFRNGDRDARGAYQKRLRAAGLKE